MSYGPQNRIDALIAYSIKCGQHPYKNSFVGFVHAKEASKFGVSKNVADSDVKTLIKAWYADKWRDLIENNQYIQDGQVLPEEVSAWSSQQP